MSCFYSVTNLSQQQLGCKAVMLSQLKRNRSIQIPMKKQKQQKQHRLESKVWSEG